MVVLVCLRRGRSFISKGETKYSAQDLKSLSLCLLAFLLQLSITSANLKLG